MKWLTLRRLVASALLAFAAASVVGAVRADWRRASRAGDEAARFGVGPGQDKTIVYYLHATLRCEACNTVEAVGEQVVRQEFSEGVRDGQVEWRPVDYQANEWLANHYQVGGSTIVVARFEGGREVRANRLMRVLELAGNRPELADYIRKGLRFEEESAPAPTALWGALAAAMGLGLLVAISPCPLATTVTAVSFLGRGAVRPRRVLLAGLAYAAGSMAAYVGLGVLIAYVLWAPWSGAPGAEGGSAGAGLSRFLQRYGGMAIGPALVLAGIVLSGLVRLSASLNLGGAGLQRKASGGQAKWAFLLGLLFALSFCPTTAAIFFGSTVALSARSQSPVLLPAAFGAATAAPVLGFAVLIAFAGSLVGGAYNRLARLDRWLRPATGVVFILAGAYLCLAHTYGFTVPWW